MEIRQASSGDVPVVKSIVETTIRTVYPHYYPAGAVQLFLDHHCEEHIAADLFSGRVFLLYEANAAVGTVTLNGNEICRLFVLPELQRKGYGTALLDFAESEVLRYTDTICLDASLPGTRPTTGITSVTTLCSKRGRTDVRTSIAVQVYSGFQISEFRTVYLFFIHNRMNLL